MPFVLVEAERQFLRHAFQTDVDGRLVYQEQAFSASKKSGKTGFAAIHLLTTVLLFGGRYAEAYCVANDLEQATSRVFEASRRIIEASPLLTISCFDELWGYTSASVGEPEIFCSHGALPGGPRIRRGNWHHGARTSSANPLGRSQWPDGNIHNNSL